MRTIIVFEITLSVSSESNLGFHI